MPRLDGRALLSSLSDLSSLSAFAPASDVDIAEGFCLAAMAGRLIEIGGQSAGAALTVTFRLVKEAQEKGEPVAWLCRAGAGFFPPDVAEGGVDLDALVVVRLPDAGAIPRAADQLARSGAFALLVLDLGADVRVPAPLLSRLLGLAQKHETAVVFLTGKPAPVPALGSLISLRGEAQRRREGNGFVCTMRVLKDKRRAPGWTYQEVCRGPAGLR